MGIDEKHWDADSKNYKKVQKALEVSVFGVIVIACGCSAGF